MRLGGGGGGGGGCVEGLGRPPPPPPPPRDGLRFSNTTGILQKKTMWFIDVEVEQKNPLKKSWIRSCRKKKIDKVF